MTTAIPPVIRAAWVARTPDDAFAVFTNEIGAWWPLPTHGIFGAEAGGLMFRDKKLIEHALDGQEMVWGEVLEWDPPHRLSITWHPGRDTNDSSQVEVTFEPDGEGTRVVLEHRGWEAFGQDAMTRRHDYIGPNAWGGVLDHYADGAETRPDPADLDGLRHAYEQFFDAAEQGGFSDAPGEEWNADQVLAHVALNDLAIVAVCQALVHQRDLSFTNQICQEPEVLSNWIARAGDHDGLIERARRTSLQVLAALGRLSPAQLETEVPCYLTHDGEVAMDQAAQWHTIAIAAQAGVHLPAHITQLQDLQST